MISSNGSTGGFNSFAEIRNFGRISVKRVVLDSERIEGRVGFKIVFIFIFFLSVFFRFILLADGRRRQKNARVPQNGLENVGRGVGHSKCTSR